MSMTKQLWATIIASMLIALCGSLFASLLSARSYLTEQITLKNSDNANALALSLSQGEADKIKIEVAVAALFDGGQYELIRVTDPGGMVITEKKLATRQSDAPQWFVSLLPIKAEAGTAAINSGWKQAGDITLQSESRFAYQTLWRSALQMMAALALACIAAGYFGSLILRRLIPPLREVVNQASGITERRFTIIAVPKVPELAKLAEAMNLMVTRLQSMFEQEAERLEVVRRKANLDDLTGLANRNFFMAQLESALDESDKGGILILLRIAGLTEINHRLGRASADELIKAVAEQASAVARENEALLVGRLSGADFALLATDQDHAAISQQLLATAMSVAPRFAINPGRFIYIGTIAFPAGTEYRLALAEADAALAAAETNQRSGIINLNLDTLKRHPRSADEWQQILHNALHHKQVRLESFPVVNMRGQIVAHECPLRLRFDAADDWHPAAGFMPIAERLRMTSALDLVAVELGIDAMAEGTISGDLVLNLSPQSIADPAFRRRLLALLGGQRKIAGRLWLEIAESGALLHLDAVAALCRNLAPLGCRIGIEHFGHQFSQFGRLYQIGLHYLKVDSSFVAGLDRNNGNQAFLQGVRSITRASGLLLHAEGVTTETEFTQLAELGFDAATGPGIHTRPAQQ